MASHVANELKSIFHIISLAHATKEGNQSKKVGQVGWELQIVKILLWIRAPSCYALLVMINYFILFLCVYMILIIHQYLCQI
jgi:hypothetical protein